MKSDGVQPSVVVHGEVDEFNVYRLVTVLDQLVEENEHCVSLDLRDVASIDNVALGCLVESANLLGGRQRRLRLAEISGPVQRLLDRHVLLRDMFCCETHCSGRCQATRCRVDMFTFPSEIPYCRKARVRVSELAEAAGLGGDWLRDALVAVGEAITNAVRHGHSGQPDSTFTVSCLANSERIAVTISDQGAGFTVADVPRFEDALMLEHGRGIHCMNALMDEVSFSFHGGTSVRLVKHV